MDITLDLTPGTALHLPRRHRLQLRLLSGRLWLTRGGDAADFFVTPGSVLTVDGRDQVVVESDGPCAARLRLQALSRSPWSLRRWWRQWQGPAWPAELRDLDAHLLRDIGAPPMLQHEARSQAEARRLRLTLANLLGA
jgi:hypothetical protein